VLCAENGQVFNVSGETDATLRFFNEQIITTFIFATNAYADSSHYARWVHLSQAEFVIFVAISNMFVVLWFGINRLPEQAMTWRSSTNIIFSSVFIV
jgi:hypothetical protein